MTDDTGVDRSDQKHQGEKSHHGPTAYAKSCIDDIKSTFEPFFPKHIDEVVLEMIKNDGQCVYGNKCRSMD